MCQTPFQLPTVIGALDCAHVKVKKPSVFGDKYIINRKAYASVNVQGARDANEKFTSNGLEVSICQEMKDESSSFTV